MDIPDALIERGAALVREYPVVDVHGHPGRSFLAGATPDSLVVRMMPDGFEDERIAGMRAAHLTASFFSIVADLAVLGLAEGGLKVVREFAPGEAYGDFKRQRDRILSIADGGRISLGLSPAAIRAAHEADKPVAILACEGGDFIEDSLDRVAAAYESGLRSITLLHYNTNRLGDTQTAEAVHHGLTPLGSRVVQEMNRLGMIVDVAHASFETVRDVVAESRVPVMVSHSNLNTGPGQSPRFISIEHARTVTGSGGIIGAWPSGYGSDTLADFVEQVLTLVNAVGAEHVAIGSDLDGNYKPVLTEYADFPVLAAALLYRGVSEKDTGRILGTNFLRLFDEIAA